MAEIHPYYLIWLMPAEGSLIVVKYFNNPLLL